jgi:hypothetical protein
MAHQGIRYNIFISTPSDIEEEHSAIDAFAKEWNREHKDTFITISSYKHVKI